MILVERQVWVGRIDAPGIFVHRDHDEPWLPLYRAAGEIKKAVKLSLQRSEVRRVVYVS